MDVGPLVIPHAQTAKLIGPRKRPLVHEGDTLLDSARLIAFFACHFPMGLAGGERP